jgi:hypothetical protein
MLEQPLVVVGDVHLSHGGKPEIGQALAALVAAHPGAEIILNGDIFNLSLDAAERDPLESVMTMLHAEPALRQALRQHLTEAGRLTLLPGNHDAALADPALRPRLLGWLELGAETRLQVSPWFVRRGTVHVEHGHAYDPDNAPTHPLVVPGPSTEPLGVALTRRFLAPNRAFDFAHATEITPLQALKRAVNVFGARTPLLLTRYFRTSSHFCREAGWRPELAREKDQGDALVPGMAAELGLAPEVVRTLLEAIPRPTHESFERAFFRLYFDRVAASLGAGVGIGLGVVARSGTALSLAALSALYLYDSQRRGGNRYSGLPVRRLRQASARVRDITGASLVIFGHTHVPETNATYVNPGSFTYRDGEPRPYAYVERDGRGERRVVSAT